MSAAPSPDAPSGPTRRAVILTGGALGVLAGLGVLRPTRAEAAPAAPASAAATERPHRTLLGVL
ncbi:MAG: hypothetical protein J0H23_08970 [Micrococcales bacterium]|nr:hypothetical protein [Micrococcales bacterium]OJX69850.1 MAG: hypothetical protein BGO94_15435 [Micrococcales bacterium 72-143]